MCVTFFNLQSKAYQNHGIQFIIGFNRDQKSQRDTDPLGPFNQDPNIYAGRDKISGGTWLGVNIKTGLIVVLTNYDLPVQRKGKSRGKLVMSFLKTASYEGLKVEKYNQKIKGMLDVVLSQRQLYSAFNLVVYSIHTGTLFHICSEMKQNSPRILEKNYSYGMCNGPLDDLWEKTKHGLSKFQNILQILPQKQPQNQAVNNFIFSESFYFLKDNFKFDQNLQKQASVFVEPYYCETEKAQRMTKCSFVCIVRKRKDENGFEIMMKEVTYTSPDLKESYVEYKLDIGK